MICSMQPIARLIPAFLILFLVFPVLAQAGGPGGHAHNDYEHARPLLDAVDNGFAGVEADIWLRDGELLVGHDADDLAPGRTLQKLYLDPLRELATHSGGSVGADSAPFTLLIDIKTDGEATYRILSVVLSQYADILTSVADGERDQGAVTAIISGNRPKAAMAAENPRYAFYDGRLSDLDSGLADDFMPLVSDNWTRHFAWIGGDAMPPGELRKLTDIVARAHARGYALRFWSTPDQPGPHRDTLWRVLADAGVDFINTDDLAGFKNFRDPLAH